MSHRGNQHFEIERFERPTVVGGWTGDMVNDPTRTEVKPYVKTLCGEELRADYSWTSVTTEADRTTCVKCNRKLGAQAMRARNSATASKLEIVQDKEAKAGFRYEGGWKVVLDNVTIAYVGFQDHGWRIYRLDVKTVEGQPEVYLPYAPVDDAGHSGELTRDYRLRGGTLYFACRDAAALGAETMYRAGALLDSPALILQWQEAQARGRALQARWRMDRAAERERKDHAREALRSALDRAAAGELALTNFERVGLQIALDAYGPKPEEDPDDDA